VRCPTRLSPIFCRASARQVGVASPGVLRPYGTLLRVPRATATGSTRPREAKVATPSPGPPSGFLTPSAVSAATTLVTRVAPNHAYVAATPRSLAGLFHPASARGIRPSEPFLSRGAVPPSDGHLLPRGFDADHASPTRRPRRSPTGFTRAAVLQPPPTRKGPARTT
jgi:hypothetical protein